MRVRSISAAPMEQMGTEEQTITGRKLHGDGLRVVCSVALDVLSREGTEIDPFLDEVSLDLEFV